jgi:hypothetical protein
MNKIEKLISDYNAAKAEIDNKLLQIWPVGSEVEFKINCKQVVFSTGTVYCAVSNAGYLRIKHHQAKPNSRFLYRDVHCSQIRP